MRMRSIKITAVWIILTSFLLSINSFAQVKVSGYAAGSIFSENRGAYSTSGQVLFDSEIYFSGSDKIEPGGEFIWQFGAGVSSYDTLGFYSRDSYVGINNEYGKLRIGKMYTPLYDYLDRLSAISLFILTDFGGLKAGSAGTFLHSAREADIVRYDKAIDNVKFAVSYGSSNKSATADPLVYSGSIELTQSSYTLFAAADFRKDYDGDSTVAGIQAIDGSDTVIGASIMPTDKLSFLLGVNMMEAKNNSTTKKYKQESYSLKSEYKEEKNIYTLSYALLTERKDDGTAVPGTDPTIIAGQYRRNLSDRTNAYIRCWFIDNKTLTSFGSASSADKDTSKVILGVVHSF